MNLTDSDMSEHVTQARQRARLVLGGEGHRVATDDWRHALLTARNALILLVLTWTLVSAFAAQGSPRNWGLFLLADAIGLSIFLGISAGLRTHTEVTLLDAELDRERREIQENPQDEREEVRALYAAKGFREPLLSDVVDVLCSDDDRLLKVMMEEELGLFIQPSHHPVVVGLTNAGAAMAACLAVAIPLSWISASTAARWVPASSAVLVALLAGATARFTGQHPVPLAARWLGLGVVTVGIAHFLGQWLAGPP